MARRPRLGGAGELPGPGSVRRRRAHQDVHRLVEVVGHLHRQRPARRELRQEPRQERGMVGQPLQHRVGEDEVEGPGRLPGGDVGHLEAHVRQALAGGGDHVGGAVDPERAGPPGKRARRSSVEFPGPQPRSTAAATRAVGTCARRSRAGRVRSSSKRR